MTVAQILGYLTQLAIDWGIMPFIAAGMLVMTTVGAFVGLRRLFVGS